MHQVGSFSLNYMTTKFTIDPVIISGWWSSQHIWNLFQHFQSIFPTLKLFEYFCVLAYAKRALPNHGTEG
jgi:hypothetical protein